MLGSVSESFKVVDCVETCHLIGQIGVQIVLLAIIIHTNPLEGEPVRVAGAKGSGLEDRIFD